MSLKAKIEAVLFLTDKPIRSQAIARIVNADVQLVRQTVLELISEYEERQGGLEIAQDNGYIIQVRDEHAQIVEEFLPMEMSHALIRTLSAIAIKQPVTQSEIIKIRGAGAYEHIKELIVRELVAKKEDGRSPILTTTRRFQEYFRLTRDAKSLRGDLKKQETASANQLKIGEVEGAGGALPDEDSGAADAFAEGVIDRLLDGALDAVAPGQDEQPEPGGSGDEAGGQEAVSPQSADGAAVS